MPKKLMGWEKRKVEEEEQQITEKKARKELQQKLAEQLRQAPVMMWTPMQGYINGAISGASIASSIPGIAGMNGTSGDASGSYSAWDWANPKGAGTSGKGWEAFGGKGDGSGWEPFGGKGDGSKGDDLGSWKGGGWDSSKGASWDSGKGGGKTYGGKALDGRPKGPSGPHLPRRRVVDSTVYGEVAEWKLKYGWIMPSETVDHPMARKHGGKIYVAEKDLKNATSLTEGQTCAFYIYTDASGSLGAEEVMSM